MLLPDALEACLEMPVSPGNSRHKAPTAADFSRRAFLEPFMFWPSFEARFPEVIESSRSEWMERDATVLCWQSAYQ